ncbi:sacsin N-terminal ATP-binding-like domain-containing protein, partial [Chloroflexota bacterium]
MATDINTYWISWQTTEWHSWLVNEVEKRRTVFLTDPDQMKQAFNQEKSAARDYYGRELLELLQNADDAGAEQERNNRVMIELDDQILYVANTGKPFSPAGIKSLMISDNSPKQLSRTRFIGYKGLGFRSVLGWASEIAIFSGNLEIGFTEEKAIRTAKELGEKNESIDLLNKQFVTETQTYPMAVLSCLFWINDYHSTNPLFETMAKRCRSIIREGYDTCIGFVLKNPENIRDKVISQISSLGKELLIFSNYLTEVNIKSEEININWEAIRQDKEVVISSDDAETSLWEVFKRTNPVPPEYIGPGQPKEMSFEIKVAIPDDGKGSDFLYVYFPTQVRFPFPVVAHATFELASNRQHIVESDINRFLCSELASVMGEAAEKSVDQSRPWKALSIVSPTSTIDPVLDIMDFNENLLSICSKNKIIPVRENGFLGSDSAKTIKGNFDDLLSGQVFSDLIMWTGNTNITKQMKNLGADDIGQAELRDRINEISSSLPVEERSRLIKKLVDNEIFNENFSPSILIDSQGKIIPKNISPFLPPEGQMFSLPEWAPPRFVNNDLVEALRKQFGMSRVRDLATKLKIFKVQEYNFTSILQSIVAETNRRVQASQDNELQFRKEMLNAIWHLYRTRVGDDTISTAQRITYNVPTRAGTCSPSDELYFGKEYPSGELMEALLGNMSPLKFISDPDGLGLGAVGNDLEPFLRWLGVTNLPRLQTQASSSNTKYRDYVLSSFKYPVRFEEFQYKDVEEVKADYPRIRQVQTFDSIEEILKSSNPQAILTWIAIDSRIERLRNEDDTGARATVLPYKKQNYRSLRDRVIPSYPVWLFENTEWLPTGTVKQSPVRCTIARGLPTELSNII